MSLWGKAEQRSIPRAVLRAEEHSILQASVLVRGLHVEAVYPNLLVHMSEDFSHRRAQ